MIIKGIIGKGVRIVRSSRTRERERECNRASCCSFAEKKTNRHYVRVILSLRLLLFGEHGKGEKTRDDDDGKNEEKHNNNNGSIVFDDVNDDVNKVVFEDVPLPRRALSSSMFSFVVRRFRLGSFTVFNQNQFRVLKRKIKP